MPPLLQSKSFQLQLGKPAELYSEKEVLTKWERNGERHVCKVADLKMCFMLNSGSSSYALDFLLKRLLFVFPEWVIRVKS